MKKLSLLIAICALCVLLLVPVGAASWTSTELTNEFDTYPDWINSATVVELEDQCVDGKSNAISASQMDLFTYVYLKDLGLGDYTVEFDVEKDGLYNIGFMLMAWSKSVPRTTNIRIDDADWIRLEYDYADEDSYSEHYWTGLTISLAAGKHTLTLSLTEDFDNSTVKSLYFDKFYYAYAGEAATEPVAVEPTAAATSDTAFDTYQEYPEDRAVGEELLFATGDQQDATGFDAKGGIDVDLWNLKVGGNTYCPKRDTSVWYDFEVKEATEVTFIIDYIANAGKERGVDYAVDDPNGENRVFIDLVESDEHQWVVGTFTVEAGKHTFYVYAPSNMDDDTLKSCDVFCVELYGSPAVTEPVETEPVETEPAETEPVVTEPVETEPVVTEPVVTEPVVTEPAKTESAETAPQTFDAALIFAVTAAISLSGISIAKKRK